MYPKSSIVALCAIACAALASATFAQPPAKAKLKEGWASVPGGTVFLRPGIDAYEHSTGLVRDTRTGQKYRPLTPHSYPANPINQQYSQPYPDYPLAFANPYATPYATPPNYPPQPTPWNWPAQTDPLSMPAAPSNCPDGNCPLQLPDFAAAPSRQVKTGGYACASCNRLTVGDGWQTYWTPEGQPVTFVCKQCWDAMSPQARQLTYAQWLARQQPRTTSATQFPR